MSTGIPSIVKNETLSLDKNAKIILFGSRARNEAREESDWDFLILSEKADSYHWKTKVRDKLYQVELESEQIISSIIHTPDHWNRLTITPIYQIISKEGIAV